MESYIVSARKYRPSTFKSVVGQKALTGTLKNAVASGRLAQSYLFCGSRGVGKTSCARIFAKAINCENRTSDGEPCNQCESCKAFNKGTSMNIIELDAASNNSVDDIRELVNQVQIPPTVGKYRVFIVDEVHMLSPSAFNAFLKTLEEPPAYVVFILATTEKNKIIPTILSRCQIYDFHRITIPDMVEHLSWVAENENIKTEKNALAVIARKADGAMRDALSIFDQVAASSRGNITYKATIENLNVLDDSYYNRILDAAVKGDPLDAWLIFREIRDKGFDAHFFINGLADYFRNLMVASEPRTLSLLETDPDTARELQLRAQKCPPAFLYKAMNYCNEADLNYRNTANKQFLVELTLAKICQSFSPSPNNGSDGEGQLKPIAAAKTKPITVPVQPKQESSAPKSHPSPTPPPILQVETPRKTTIGPNISINKKIADTPERDLPKEQKQKRNNSFSLPELDTAWEDFISQHAKERILINTMRTSRPSALGDNKFLVEVENDIQLAAINENIPLLTSHLADSLGNDNITLITALRQGELMRHVLNDRELLAEMIKENPAIDSMITALKLRLS